MPRPLLLALLATAALLPLDRASAGPTEEAEQVLRQSEYFVLGILGRGGGSSPQTAVLC